MKTDKYEIIGLVFALLYIVIALSLWGAAMYIIWHFISKVW